MNLKPLIIFENEDLLVINKPAGMVVNRAKTVREATVADWMEAEFKDCFKVGDGEEEVIFKERSGIAHRLDKETSGALLIAKNPKALSELMRQFKQREVKKEYLALVHGKVEPKMGVVRLPLRRNRKDRKKWQVGIEGKVAETSW